MKLSLKINVSSILFVLFSYVFMITHVVEIKSLLANFLVALLGILALIISLLKKKNSKQYGYLVTVGIIFSLFMLLSIVYNGNADLLDLIWIWCYLGIAILIYENEISQKVYFFVASSIIIWIFAYILSGKDAAQFLTYGSQNNISAYVLFFVIIYYISNIVHNKKQPYILLFLTAAICLWTGSRAGILASFVLIIGNFVCNFLFIKKGKTIELLKWLIVLFVAIWLLNHYFGPYLMPLFYKIERYGNTSIRTEIWSEYLNGAFNSFYNLVLGVNIKDSGFRLLNFYGGNVHNSFLALHAKFGLLPFVDIIILIVKTIKKIITEKKYAFLVVLSTVCVRMYFDWIAFPGLYDVFFWYFFLYLTNNNSKEGI